MTGPARTAISKAGGDLKLDGPDPGYVYLAAPQWEADLPALEIEDAAVASSGSQPLPGPADSHIPISPHIDTQTEGANWSSIAAGGACSAH